LRLLETLGPRRVKLAVEVPLMIYALGFVHDSLTQRGKIYSLENIFASLFQLDLLSVTKVSRSNASR
jgi:hypothetical protein